MLQFKRIVVATDFEENAKQALEAAIDLTKIFGAELVIVHTWEIPVFAYSALEASTVDLLTPVRIAAEQQLAALLASVKERVPYATAVLRCGVAWREIVSVIEETKADLVVMGTHGRRGVSRAVLGSVAEMVVRAAPAAVLTLHERPAK